MSLLSEATRREILDCTKHYPQKRAALLPALHAAQRELGWISNETMKEVAQLLDLRPADVLEVVTFYTMFNQEQIGRHHIQVCRNISCALLGARRITRHISGKLGIKTGETTPDGRFTLSEVECLGSCGTAPMLMLNDEYHENLTEPRVDEILDDLP